MYEMFLNFVMILLLIKIAEASQFCDMDGMFVDYIGFFYMFMYVLNVAVLVETNLTKNKHNY